MAQAVDTAPLESVCYSKEERLKIAKALVDLKKCEVEVYQKTQLIKQNMLTYDGLNPGPAWWQEPSFVAGGIIVSFSVGTLVTWYLLRDK